MAVIPLYPGIYHERLPSGVRTISGVGTSVAVFIGEALKGPIGQPQRIFSVSDFQRIFGGLSASFDLGYAVSHFFMNGGGEAWIVRVAASADAATAPLKRADGTTTLTVTARDKGAFGNTILTLVDWKTATPDDSFTLTVTTADGATLESFPNLTMSSADPRYAPKIVNAGSTLVMIARPDGLAFGQATSRSAPVADVGAALGATGHKLRVQMNGLDPIQIDLLPADWNGADNNAMLDALAGAIATKVKAASSDPVVQGFAAARDNGTILLTMPADEKARVTVMAATANDAAPLLKLGIANGGQEAGGTAGLRPAPAPPSGTLTGTKPAGNALDALPAAGTQKLRLMLDGAPAIDLDLGATKAVGADLAAKLGDVAARLTAAARAARPSSPAFKGFMATVDTGAAGPRLVLTSGTAGAGSSVTVLAAPAGGGSDPLAGTLGLLGGTAKDGVDALLAGGAASPITAATLFASYTGKDGLQSLSQVQAFNLLALPGITDAGVLAEAAALVEKRRAFLIVDPPADADEDDMVALTGPGGLPKSINAAVYYPRILATDPLAGGQARAMPPSGAIAGLYARTDASRGVWKAPAGTEASISGALGLTQMVDDDSNGILNPLGVNCIRGFPVYGIVNWGARTLRGSNAEANEYKYVPVSRLALYLEESLHQGLQWVLFEPNGDTLWSQIRLNVGAFMNGLFRQGAFAGTSARDAYFVKCDSDTTTAADQNLGRVNLIVGFAPLRPAEFVVISLQQIAGQAVAAA